MAQGRGPAAANIDLVFFGRGHATVLSSSGCVKDGVVHGHPKETPEREEPEYFAS